MSYFNFAKRAPKTSDLSKLIDKVDTVFSEVVRLSAVDGKGNCKCITCGDRYHWTHMDCGHFVKRRHMATRYDLQNCGPQCTTCNVANDGMEEDHAAYIDKTYGPGTADKLRKKAEAERKFMAYELNGMLEELKKELKALKEEKFR
jgi:hypothetical protein